MSEKRTEQGWKKKNAYIQNYMKDNYESLTLRMKKGERERFNSFADWLGVSRNEMIKNAVSRYMEETGYKE